jgi:hypothetical protein
MMTPQEKAKYLISINSLAILSEIGNKLTKIEVKEIAKQSALIVVDEILNLDTINEVFWLQTKQELEKP